METLENTNNKILRKPEWLKIRIPDTEDNKAVGGLSSTQRLHTICESGSCPNSGDCWARRTATFMILGDICTRACKFCNVKTGKPLPVDEFEHIRVAESIRLLKLKHCVITSVDRDDLPDKGADMWVKTIKTIKRMNPQTTIEVLIPDFDGDEMLIQRVIDAEPEVISHNLETVERLTPHIRSRAKYRTSLKVLKQIADSGIVAKSGIMLGLGETREEIIQTMDDLRQINCKVLTIGQYLQPSRKHVAVQEYIHPDIFKEYETIGLKKGFSFVESSPLVRSSYKADRHVNA